MTPNDADREGRLPILGTIGLASSLVDHAPGQLTFLVAAEAALLTLGRKLVDRLDVSALAPWLVKEAHFVVEEVVYAIMTGAIVAVAHSAAEGRRCGTGAVLWASAVRFCPMLLVCAAIDIASALDFPYIPFIHLAGLIIRIFCAVATPVCMIERLGPIASLSRSVALTRGNRERIFGLFIVGIGTMLAALAVGALLYLGVENITDPPWLRALPIVSALILGLPTLLLVGTVGIIGAVAPTAIYLNLRSIESGRLTQGRLDEITTS